MANRDTSSHIAIKRRNYDSATTYPGRPDWKRDYYIRQGIGLGQNICQQNGDIGTDLHRYTYYECLSTIDK